MERVVLGGVDLSAYCTVLVGPRPLPSVEPVLERVAGFDGYRFNGADLVPQPITLKLVAFGSAARRTELLRELAPVLASCEPAKLAMSGDNGRYRMVVPTGEIESAPRVTGGSVTLALQPLEAAMHGDERSVTVPSGGSVTFIAGGNHRTRPVIRASAVRNSTSKLWGVRLDGGDFIHVATGSSSARAVVLDCDARTCTVQGLTALPTLDSDWLEFEPLDEDLNPIEHVLSIDNGTGAATVTWTERWL